MNQPTDADRLFERYCRGLGYRIEWEPYPPAPRQPDFAVWPPNGQEIAVEVKSIESLGIFGDGAKGGSRTLAEAAMPISRAIRDAAGQLRPLRGHRIPLVVALANVVSSPVSLDPVAVISAMYGEIGVEFPLDGGADDARWVTGRNGRLTGGSHAYLSAILILRCRAFAQDWAETWWKARDDGHDPRKHIPDFLEAARRESPPGDYVWAEVYETIGEDAVSLPSDAFAGPRDARWSPTPDGAGMVRVR